jgi:hypothetical protein
LPAARLSSMGQRGAADARHTDQDELELNLEQFDVPAFLRRSEA